MIFHTIHGFTAYLALRVDIFLESSLVAFSPSGSRLIMLLSGNDDPLRGMSSMIPHMAIIVPFSFSFFPFDHVFFLPMSQATVSAFVAYLGRHIRPRFGRTSTLFRMQ